MQSILDAIKKYPAHFASTAAHRAGTTPSEINKRKHIELQQAIQTQNWEKVKEIIKDPQYYHALKGVVYCLEQVTGIDGSQWCKICGLMDENKII